VESISQAAEIASEQEDYRREKALAQRRQVTLDNLFSEIAAGELKEFNVIVKADVQGSVDVLRDTIMEMNTSEVAVRILHSAVGGITESDVLLAQASNAIIIGFQVIADEHARNIAEKEGVEIRLYRIIYQISDDIKKALEGLLKPRIEEKPLGRAEVRQIFRVSRMGIIAGCLVTNGFISRSARLRVIRDNVVIRDNSSVESLRRIKDDASEVRSGLECGIKLAGFDDLKIGDLIEAYELVEISRTLNPVE
jgi:translation initiation factor IF-2